MHRAAEQRFNLSIFFCTLISAVGFQLLRLDQALTTCHSGVQPYFPFSSLNLKPVTKFNPLVPAHKQTLQYFDLESKISFGERRCVCMVGQWAGAEDR